MSVFTPLPTLYVDFIAPEGFAVDVVGGGIDGGRDIYGEGSAIDFSGGGRVTVEYRNCNIFEPEQHEIINMVAARMNGSHRYINAVIMSDFAGPFPGGQPIIGGITHSDGSYFSDGAGYSQVPVFGKFAAPAALNAGEVTVKVYGATRHLRWSDWFSTFHAVKGWRAYRYWEVRGDPVEVSETIDGVLHNGYQYVLALEIPLREAVVADQKIELARPRFVARFPRDFTLPYSVESTYVSRPTLKFIEP